MRFKVTRKWSSVAENTVIIGRTSSEHWQCVRCTLQMFFSNCFCCWFWILFKAPFYPFFFQYPERYFHLNSGVTAVDFSAAHPNLLAVSIKLHIKQNGVSVKGNYFHRNRSALCSSRRYPYSPPRKVFMFCTPFPPPPPRKFQFCFILHTL